MDLFIVVEEEGEYSSREWRNVNVLKDKNEAIKFAWLSVMNDWQKSFHVEHWRLDEDITNHEATYYLYANMLRHQYTSQCISRLEEELQTSDTIPEILMKYVLTN